MELILNDMNLYGRMGRVELFLYHLGIFLVKGNFNMI